MSIITLKKSNGTISDQVSHCILEMGVLNLSYQYIANHLMIGKTTVQRELAKAK